MTTKEIKQAKKIIETKRPAEGYSTILYSDGNIGLECRYTDITKIFWTLADVLQWV